MRANARSGLLNNIRQSGFYDYLHCPSNGPDDSRFDAVTNSRIKAIFKLFRTSDVFRRALRQLRYDGNYIGCYKVRRLIRELGFKAKIRKRFKVTPEAAIRFRWPKFS
jgi:hypothetical protein